MGCACLCEARDILMCLFVVLHRIQISLYVYKDNKKIILSFVTTYLVAFV